MSSDEENNANIGNDSIAEQEAFEYIQKKNITPEMRKQTRRSYKMLLNSTAQFDDVDCTEIDKRKFGKAMKFANKLFDKVDSPQEAVLDAKVVKHLSRLTKNQVECLSVNAQKFTVTEFADKLFASVHSAIDIQIPGKSEDDIHQGMFIQHWELLGDQCHAYMAKPAYLQHLLGSMEREPNSLDEKKTKARAPRKSLGDGTGLATQMLMDDGKGKVNIPETGASLTEMLVESTMMHLKEIYLLHDKATIPYFEFILDPKSFAKSVENMFHVSFLVKEGRAKIILEESEGGLPYIKPIMPRGEKSQRKSSGGGIDRNQAILSLTVEEWEELVEIFKIEKAMIQHDIQALRNKQIGSKRSKKSS